VTEPGISQVVYREITEKSPQVWLAFTAPKEFALFIQIGVPVIDRLKDFRPSMAVVGPGLQGEIVPFKIPEKAGAKVFSTQEVTKPRFFHEHFTSTDSWILRSETVKLSEPGRYYVVAFSPQKHTGKLWVSIGKKESFSLKDLGEFPIWRKRIQKYHEVKKNEPSTSTVEIRRLDQSNVDIKVISDRPFPANTLTVLSIGHQKTNVSRYAKNKLNILVFTMPIDDFAKTQNGDAITVQYGPDFKEHRDFGKLDKGKVQE